MKTIEGKDVYVFSPEDEKPHKPGPEESWQESFVLYWYDKNHKVGGFFRLGHEPNHEGGKTSFVIAVFSPGSLFRRTEKLALRESDRMENGFKNGDDSLIYEFDGEKIIWTLKEKDIDLKVECELYVPPIDAHRSEGDYSGTDILSAHVDAACGVTGTLNMKGETYQVAALGLRDHACGTRDLRSLLSYRWLIGSFGERDSFVAMTFLSTANNPARFGWVIRDDKVILAEEVDVKTVIGEDGATIFGGELRMTLSTGEEYQVKFDPLYPSFATSFEFLHPTFYHDSFCRLTWGKKVGFGILEGTNNIRGGILVPEVFIGSVGTDGWHQNFEPFAM